MSHDKTRAEMISLSFALGWLFKLAQPGFLSHQSLFEPHALPEDPRGQSAPMA
jgi:hypothetical protein